MKINYTGAWLRLRAAGFLPVERLSDTGRGVGMMVIDIETRENFNIDYHFKGYFLAERIDGLILEKKEGMVTRTYRGKFDGEAQDDNAYPAFNAESLDDAVRLANKKWPAAVGENDFTGDDMQVFTNKGWVWAKNYNG